MRILALVLLALLSRPGVVRAEEPMRVVVIGLVHGHVHWILGAARDRDDIDLVGVYEPDRALFDRFATQYRLSPDLYFDDLNAMLDQASPEAASVMTSTFDHLRAVEACAPRGIDVLIEKPLAVSVEHAQRMAALSREHDTLVLTNYETSWYASVHEAHRRLPELGEVRRIVARHGHKGPREIGCSEEFLAWLTKPEPNGAGALFDFGCYGANLATWIMDGARPESVTAITRQNKPDIYPDVDDDATIILTYAGAVATIQASWCWTHDVKEIDIFAEGGSVQCAKWNDLTIRLPDRPGTSPQLDGRDGPYTDMWTYLRRVSRRECPVDPLSSLENNLIVTEILDAARTSAATGRTVLLHD